MLMHGIRRLMQPALASLLALCLTTGLAASDESPGSDDDALFAQGRDVYRRCAACHVPNAPQNRVGPHLVGMFGRTAGGLDDFRYSSAMRESGIVWTEETVAAYLRDPRRYIPGNRMAFAGIRRDEDMAALMVYLRRVTEPE